MIANPEGRNIPRWAHWCDRADGREVAPINEHDPDIIYCRRYTSTVFLAAQDAMAVWVDAQRKTR